MRFAIVQINTDLLINHLKNVFTQDTLHPSFISKNVVLSNAEVARNIYFLSYFDYF